MKLYRDALRCFRADLTPNGKREPKPRGIFSSRRTSWMRARHGTSAAGPHGALGSVGQDNAIPEVSHRPCRSTSMEVADSDLPCALVSGGIGERHSCSGVVSRSASSRTCRCCGFLRPLESLGTAAVAPGRDMLCKRACMSVHAVGWVTSRRFKMDAAICRFDCGGVEGDAMWSVPPLASTWAWSWVRWHMAESSCSSSPSEWMVVAVSVSRHMVLTTLWR